MLNFVISMKMCRPTSDECNVLDTCYSYLKPGYLLDVLATCVHRTIYLSAPFRRALDDVRGQAFGEETRYRSEKLIPSRGRRARKRGSRHQTGINNGERRPLYRGERRLLSKLYFSLIEVKVGTPPRILPKPSFLLNTEYTPYCLLV